jgi:hypothetical protein
MEKKGKRKSKKENRKKKMKRWKGMNRIKRRE